MDLAITDSKLDIIDNEINRLLGNNILAKQQIIDGAKGFRAKNKMPKRKLNVIAEVKNCCSITNNSSSLEKMENQLKLAASIRKFGRLVLVQRPIRRV